jgi:hypothetical protein
MQCANAGCENDAKQSATGRPGKYCSNRCRLQAFRHKSSETKPDETKLPDILFYCGLNETNWNHHPMEPGEHICIAPVTTSTIKDKDTGAKRKVLRNTNVYVDPAKVKHVLLDSGAFSDGLELDLHGKIVKNNRLSFDAALRRQFSHAHRYEYTELVESVVSYDLLIDETWQDGERSKKRWSVSSAEIAVQETINAARYLSTQRRRIDAFFGHHVNLILSAQGISAEQYRRCAEAIVKVMKPDDIFGLGGWCITGLARHDMLPAAALMLPGVFEVLGKAGVKRVHVFGVIIPALLGFLLRLCDEYGIALSTDSAGPCVEPARNGNWGYGSWTNPSYKVVPILESCKVLDAHGEKAPTCSQDTICRGLDRIRHTALTHEWLAHFRERESHLVKMLSVPVLPDCTQMRWEDIA